MSIFTFLLEKMSFDDELGAGEDDLDTTEEKSSVEGDPKALVDAMLKYAPGKSQEIKNMLKYSAHSNPDYDIFDSALDYFESIEDDIDSSPEPEVEEEPMVEPTDEEPMEEPSVKRERPMPKRPMPKRPSGKTAGENILDNM